MKDDNYRQIINHRNYNPRTIEWITGLAGRWDASMGPDEYVEFALESLERPERIWKHAFEQEIDDHGTSTRSVARLTSPVESAFNTSKAPLSHCAACVV